MMSPPDSAFACATHVPCAGCGCGCDDIAIDLASQLPVGLDCSLGRKWLVAADESEPAAQVGGSPSSVEAAIARGAELLRAAKSPMVYGLTYASCEGQAAAIDLAEACGATLDLAEAGRDVYGTPLQNLGAIAATFGELRDRADLVVLWNVDVEATNPRLIERYLNKSGGEWPEIVSIASSKGRRLVGDSAIGVSYGAEAAAANLLRGLIAGRACDAGAARKVGTGLETWQALADRLLAARYAVFVLPPRGSAAFGPRFAPAFAKLVRELNDRTRAAAIALSHGNAAGAVQMLAARTGFPCAVSFARGWPQFDPLGFDADRMLAAGEVDLVVAIGETLEQGFSGEAVRRLADIPTLVVDSRAGDHHRRADVSFLTARPGVQCAGTFFRADGIALPLRKRGDARRMSDAEVLAAVRCAARNDQVLKGA